MSETEEKRGGKVHAGRNDDEEREEQAEGD
jgi:hypothetical protein